MTDIRMNLSKVDYCTLELLRLIEQTETVEPFDTTTNYSYG